MTVHDVETSFTADWEQWHRAHEARRADPHGFLAVTSLNWLTETPQRFSDAPGEWSTGDGGVLVVLADEEELVLDGRRVTGEHRFGVIAERASVNATWGDAVIEVAKRGGHDVIRPRHPDNALLAAYTGTAAYPSDPRWAVQGRWVAFDVPRPTAVGAAVAGLKHVYDAPGRVELELDGQPLALTAFPGHGGGTLLVLFTDATSGVTTYAANRSLSLEAPAADGTVLVDFNRAVNLPCAYTDHATCPLPPTENRLAVAVEAGEKIPRERGGQVADQPA